MAFVPGFNSRYYVGPMRFSVFGRSVTASQTTNQLDVTTFENQSMVYINGQKSSSVSLDMIFDTAYATTSQITTINTWQDTAQPITLGLDGTALAATAFLALGNQSSATISSQVAEAVDVSVEVQPDGQVDWGQIIAIEAAVTADGNGTAVDGGAASTNGGVAHIHTTAFSGLTSNAVTIEGSANGSTGWALVTGASFATITGVGSERLVIAPGTAVPRYLRVVDDVTGSGSHTRVVAFARR